MPNPFGQTIPAPMQPAVNGQPNPLQQPAFGQLPASQQPNPLGAPAPSSSPFAQLPPQPEQQSGFNQPAGTATGGFGNASNTTGGAFPGNAQPTNTTAGATTNQPQLSIQEGQVPERASQVPDGLNMRPALNGETMRDPQTNKLTRWKGQPVLYVKGDPRYQHPDNPSVFMHIFFPDKQPTVETLGDTQGVPEDYTPEIEETYKQAKLAGRFTKGVPKVPPKPEWCSFDL
ncbi:40S ribosomal protein S20 [Ascosphaera pollenicola]|nr:40S ribosomal protein S20 [Ascosphaera pollenicola]